MAKQIRVRRDRPSALTWAVALAVTMLAVYLATLGTPATRRQAETASAQRVTQEIVLEGMAAHFADFGCHEDGLQARIAAARLAVRGAAGYVYADAEGSHVLGAVYENRADAERIAAQIGAEEEMETSVLTLSAQPVPMRITAQEPDIACIVEADGVLRAQLEQVGAMALQVDRGELSAASARTLAAISRSELRAASGRLEKVNGAAENAVCAGLIEQLDSLAGALGGVARGEDSGASLSGRLRCCHVDGMLRLIGFLNGLKNG